MNQYKHAASISTAVHDGMVSWVRRLMDDAGMQEMEIWGRFPPEGTVRSYMVLFPYRVGPGPMLRENAPGVTLMLPTRNEEMMKSVPWAWRQFAAQMMEGIDAVYQGAANYQPGQQIRRNPYPLVENLPGPMQDWYKSMEGDEDGWTLRTSAGLHARMPALAYKPGIRVTVHYLAVANDPGRGTSQRMSDAAPLAMPALTVLTTGIQLDRTIRVMVPPKPVSEKLVSFADAYMEAWKAAGAEPGQIGIMRECVMELTEPYEFEFHIAPLNDLNDQEFALLTQALQRPLQAVLNFRIRYPTGFSVEFLPSTMVAPATSKAPR